MSGGGGESSPQTQVITPDRPPGPLETGAPSHLFPQMENMLEANLPYSQFGGGFNLAPRNPFGQVYVPGPNPTIYGNPYNYNANATPYFGQSALTQGGSNVGMQPQAQGGGQQGGQGGGGSQQQNPFAPGNSLMGSQLQFLFPSLFTNPNQNQQTQSPTQQQQQPSTNQQQPNTPTPVVNQPAPPAYNQNTIGGDPYGIAAGNAPVGSNGLPMSLEQMQQLEQQIKGVK